MVLRRARDRSHRRNLDPGRVDRASGRRHRKNMRGSRINMSPINWLSFFKWNRAHRSTIAWQPTLELAPHLRAPLIRSLQKFQVGESGEGRHLREHAAKTGDANYAAAIELFIRSEEHTSELQSRFGIS